MAKSDLPWPRKGDKLFVADDRSDGKSFHLGSIMWSWPQHAEAFKAAADMVIESYEQAPRRPYRDDLLFPVAYLYRHAIELKLKLIVRYGVAMHCYTKADVEKTLGEHNLAKLWTKAKLAIDNRWPQGDPAPVKAVDAIINEMHQADKDGQTWRYETGRDGSLNRHEGLPEFVSLRSLRRTMDNVFTFLDACADGIDDGLQSTRDAMY